jgi:hypothetical protein
MVVIVPGTEEGGVVMTEFLQNNWFWIALVGVFFSMHALGVGCCGHGRHRSHDAPEAKPNGDQPK